MSKAQSLISGMTYWFEADQGQHETLMDVIGDLTAEQAAWSPQDSIRSTWEMINHITFWKRMFVHFLSQGHWPDALPDHEGWPPVPAEASDEDWQATIQVLRDTHQELLDSFAKLDDATLAKQNPNALHPLEFYPYGLMGHDGYHAGQIMTLRELQGIPFEKQVS